MKMQTIMRKINLLFFRNVKKIHLSFLFVIIFALIPQGAFSEIIQGEGSSSVGDHLDLGFVKVPWSKANNYFGYIYEIDGLSFGKVEEGVGEWGKCRGYKTYEGFSDVSVIDDNSSLSFTQENMIVFSVGASENSDIDSRGVLVFKYNDLFGAIDFIKIENNTLTYKYWYNTSGTCSFSDAPEVYVGSGDDSSASTTQIQTTFGQDYVYEFDYSQEYDSVEISGGATVIANSYFNVSDSLVVSDGTLILKGELSRFNNLEIKADGKVEIFFDGEIFISGNFINQGELIVNSGNVVFNGEKPQSISGNTSFYALDIESESYVRSEQVSVDELSIYEGCFIPGTDSQFKNVFIDLEGILSPARKAVITLNGDMDNTGRFFHNKGTVSCNSGEEQYVHLNGSSFYNLYVKNGSTVTVDEDNVENTLSVDADSEYKVADDSNLLYGP